MTDHIAAGQLASAAPLVRLSAMASLTLGTIVGVLRGAIGASARTARRAPASQPQGG